MIGQQQVDLFSRNILILGSTCYGQHAMFKKYRKKHNKGTFVWFVKPSECQMGGELTSLLHLLCLEDALSFTIMSKEFLNLNKFKEECFVLNIYNCWMYLFLMCYILYAPMHVLRLADQQTAAMDKLYYYILQIDWMMLNWLPNCKQKSKALLMDSSLGQVMTT